jgi:hypothetical protein
MNTWLTIGRKAADPALATEAAGCRHELRCAVRFPLSLPVVLETLQGEVPGITRNISASGVLFALGQRLKTGARIQYSLRMPGHVLGATHDVLVHCTGRVVRCSLSQSQHLAAATIDEYRFVEQ